MEVVELTNFIGGLALRPAADDLKINQVQSAENVDFTLSPGAVQVRRGIAKECTALFEGNLDIHYQKLFGGGGLMIRDGGDLYDTESRLIKVGLTDGPMQFIEFDDFILFESPEESDLL